MAKPNHLLKRGSRYYVRVRIPTDLVGHPRYGKKPEIVRSLGTSDYKIACKLVRERAREIHLEFDQVRAGPKTKITEQEAELLCRRMIESRMSADEEARYLGDLVGDYGYQRHLETAQDNDAAARDAIARGKIDRMVPPAMDWLTGHGYELNPESEDFKRFIMLFARRSAEANKMVRARDEGEPVETPKVDLVDSSSTATGNIITVGHLVTRYLDKADKDKPMYSKYNTVLPLFKEVVGERKPFAQLKQIDIENFCHFVCRLPPRWSDQVRQRKVSVIELAKEDHEKTISPKTYQDTYLAALKPFLKEAIRVFGDQGFPRHLTTDGISYTGNAKDGESKQRSLTEGEIKKLFEGEFMRKARAKPETEHEFWFPLVGLYSGARINEVCQLNPQCDIREEEGMWVFEFSNETETDKRVKKSLKNQSASKRIIPIHQKLIDLGFLKYVERIKKTGSKLLFPQWAPSVGKASAGAQEAFGKLLTKLDLRDDTPGKKVTGYHIFRHTMENRALNLEVDNIRIIVGHAGNRTTVERGYEGVMELPAKKRILDRIWFNLAL